MASNSERTGPEKENVPCSAFDDFEAKVKKLVAEQCAQLKEQLLLEYGIRSKKCGTEHIATESPAAAAKVRWAQAEVALVGTDKATQTKLETGQAPIRSGLTKGKFALTKIETPFKTTVQESLESPPMIESPKNGNFHFKDDEPMGLAVGEHEGRRRMLAAERQADYNKYVSEKESGKRLQKSSNSKQLEQNPMGSSFNYQKVFKKLQDEEEQYGNSRPIANNELEKERPNTRVFQNELEYLRTMTRQCENIFRALSIGTNSDPNTNSLGNAEPTSSSPQISHSRPSTSSYARLRRPHPSDSSIGQNEFGLVPMPNVSVIKDNYVKELDKQIQQNRLREAPNLGFEKKSPDHQFSSYNIRSRRVSEGDKANSGVYGIYTDDFEIQQRREQRYKKENYRMDLQKQIAENQRLAKELKKNKIMEEELLAHRAEEQRLQQVKEYQEEQTRRNNKEEQNRLKRERLAELHEARAKEEAKRRREEAERRQQEREKSSKMESRISNPPAKPPSPPVPSMRTQATLTNQPQKLGEPSTSAYAASDDYIYDQLAELRRIMSFEQKEYESAMHDEKKTYKVMDRRAVQEESDEDEDDTAFRNNAYRGKSPFDKAKEE